MFAGVWRNSFSEPLIVFFFLFILFAIFYEFTFAAVQPLGRRPPPLGTNHYGIEGIVFASWLNGEYQTQDAKDSLHGLAGTGANYVGVLGTWYMTTTPADGERSKSNTIFTHPTKSPSDQDLITAISRIKALNRKVFLKLHVRVILSENPWSDAWAGAIQPSNPSQWFESYRSFVDHYARLAQANGVDLLAFGTELNSMTPPSNAASWNSIIDTIKASYTGKLTFSSNMFNEYRQIPFWNRMDYLGIGPYFSLTSSSSFNPGLDEIVNGWYKSPVDEGVPQGNIIAELADWSSDNGNKPVLFTEIGYTSVDTATYQPWKGTGTFNENQELQKRAYDALSITLQKQPWFAGTFFWTWLTDPNAGTTDLSRRDYTPQNKPASLQSLNNFYMGIDTLAHLATLKIVDGDKNEIPDNTLVKIGEPKNLYAYGFNANGGGLGFISVTWQGSSLSATITSNDIGFARVTATGDGTITVTVTEPKTQKTDSVVLRLGHNYLRVPSEYPTIQDAARVARVGDIILVAPNTYTGRVDLNQGVSLVSERGASETILDSTGETVAILGGERVQGFTIKNTNGPAFGRIFPASLQTRNIINNIIENNKGGIDLYGAQTVIKNNIIRNNQGGPHGGGIRLDGWVTGEIINNVIIGNSANDGGGIYISTLSNVLVLNNIIVDNAGAFGAGIRVYQSPSTIVDYNNTFNNTGLKNIEGVIPGPGSISSDPKFVNKTAGDYHLQPDSPSINAGHPDSKHNDRDGSRNDHGVYGGPLSL